MAIITFHQNTGAWITLSGPEQQGPTGSKPRRKFLALSVGASWLGCSRGQPGGGAGDKLLWGGDREVKLVMTGKGKGLVRNKVAQRKFIIDIFFLFIENMNFLTQFHRISLPRTFITYWVQLFQLFDQISNWDPYVSAIPPRSQGKASITKPRLGLLTPFFIQQLARCGILRPIPCWHSANIWWMKE